MEYKYLEEKGNSLTVSTQGKKQTGYIQKKLNHLFSDSCRETGCSVIITGS